MPPAVPAPSAEEQPRGLSDDDWQELMAMAEAQSPQQQPHGERLGSAAAQALPNPGETLLRGRQCADHCLVDL